MDRDEFSLEQHIVEWLMFNGCKFREAICIVSYAQNTDRSICQAFIDLSIPMEEASDGYQENDA